MMEGLYLNIVSPEGEIFSGEVESVTLPGAMGAFTILPHHAPIVSSLVTGTIAYMAAGEVRKQDIWSGFVEMSDGKVSVCVES